MLRYRVEKDIQLKRAPLTEVICQIRFPIILKITNEKPVEFQERVRDIFPNLEVEQGMVAEMDPMSKAPPSLRAAPQIYRFKSLDGHTALSLAPNFYALSTTSYKHWKEFLERLLFINSVTIDVYKITNATRIGLRYINELTFKNTHTNTLEDLLGVLRPELTVFLKCEYWDVPQDMLNSLVLSGPNDENLGLRFGFKGGEEPRYLLDFDYYASGNISLDKNKPQEFLERYHDSIYKAFRWCIKKGKLGVFDPVSAEGEI